LAPLDVDVGSTQLVGKGFLDEDVDGGSFSFTAKAGAVTILSGGGDLCSETKIDFPLGAGSIVFKGVSCPAPAGEIEIDLDLQILSTQTFNDLVNIRVGATSTSSEKLLCMDITTDDGKLKMSNATETWEAHPDLNCYKGQGSMKDVDPPGTPMTGVVGEQDCEAACDLHRQCYAALVEKDGSCYRRGPIKLDQCENNTDYTLFIRRGPRPPLPPSPPATTPKPHYEGQIIGGVIKGLLADTDILAPCENDGFATVMQFVSVIQELKAGKVKDAVNDLGDAFGMVSPLIKECQVPQDAAKKLEDAIDDLTREQALKNFHAHQTEIMTHITAASAHHDKAVVHSDSNEFGLMGMEMGEALRRIIETDSLVV